MNIIKTFTPCYPSQDGKGSCQLGIVLVEDVRGRVSAYAGLSDDDVWIANYGAKLTLQEAVIYFPLDLFSIKRYKKG